MPNLLPIEDLKKRLFLFVKDEDKLSFEEFAHQSTRYYYQQMLTTIEVQDEVISITPQEVNISPISNVLDKILKIENSEVLLEELFYHLKNCGSTFPPIHLPNLLNLVQSWPSLWSAIYQLHPQLILKLSDTNDQFDFMKMAFDHGEIPTVGQTYFYPAMAVRMKNFPQQTVAFIREKFESVSSHHKNKLLEILSTDDHPDTLDFIDSKKSNQDKVVRITALKILLKKKYANLYPNLIAVLNPYVESQFKDKIELTKQTMGIRKDDIQSLTSKTSTLSALISLIDPADLSIDIASIPNDLLSDVVDGCLFHENMNFLNQYMQLHPGAQFDSGIETSISPQNTTAYIHHYYLTPNKSLSPTFFENILKIQPFFTYQDSLSIWTYLKKQYEEFTFIEESFPIHYFALKIHPNAIVVVLSDLTNISSDWKTSFTKILSIRKEILKILYPIK
ncbi:hypothetical protein [Membranihabitans marinus]|uniref:hypothetical protein n=1 Tax=Membranihabitans marinus TaxID=1227546 RepID=UPI001F1CFCF3|nr:hypothetical protein [Membranihabitans marinus]